jgi:hypothetical protein
MTGMSGSRSSPPPPAEPSFKTSGRAIAMPPQPMPPGSCRLASRHFPCRDPESSSQPQKARGRTLLFLERLFILRHLGRVLSLLESALMQIPGELPYNALNLPNFQMLPDSPIAPGSWQCHNGHRRSNYRETKPLASVSKRKSGQPVRQMLDAVTGRRSISGVGRSRASECRVTRACLPKAYGAAGVD